MSCVWCSNLHARLLPCAQPSAVCDESEGLYGIFLEKRCRTSRNRRSAPSASGGDGRPGVTSLVRVVRPLTRAHKRGGRSSPALEGESPDFLRPSRKSGTCPAKSPFWGMREHPLPGHLGVRRRPPPLGRGAAVDSEWSACAEGDDVLLDPSRPRCDRLNGAAVRT